MKDLVIGRGEIGYPLLEWLQKHDIKTESFDIDPQKSTFKENGEIDCIHICFPTSGEFIDLVTNYISLFKPRFCIIHSTIKPGTTEKIQKITDCPVIYSPVRGVHGRMLFDFERYPKWYACEAGFSDDEFFLRFPRNRRVESTRRLEETKIFCDTTYLGILISYRKIIDEFANVYWDFAQEIHEILGNRPVLYNDHNPIGGHCIIENLDLIESPEINELVSKLIKRFSKK